MQVFLLERAGIALDTLAATNGRITEDQFSALYRLIAGETDDEILGLFSRPVPGGAMKFAGYSMIAASTVGVALHRYSRFLRMFVVDFEVTLIRNGLLGSIVLTERKGQQPLKTMGVVLVLKVLHGVASWLVGKNIAPIEVDFSFPVPPYLDDLHALFPGPIHFDRPTNSMTFDAALLDLNIYRTEHDLRIFLSSQPRDWLTSPYIKRPVTHQVLACLLERGLGSMNVRDIARALHMSSRTLSRRLAGEQTTINKVKESLRRDLAIHRLTRTQAPISEIADDLGFGDVPSFYRAFRNWTGVAPGAYRRAPDMGDEQGKRDLLS
jgi:AraC-like DNA-binding protein